MGKRLAVLFDRDRQPVASYEVMAYWHTQPDGSLQWVDWRKHEDYPVCDVCGSQAEWFGNGERYCGKHGPGRKGRG